MCARNSTRTVAHVQYVCRPVDLCVAFVSIQKHTVDAANGNILMSAQIEKQKRKRTTSPSPPHTQILSANLSSQCFTIVSFVCFFSPFNHLEGCVPRHLRPSIHRSHLFNAPPWPEVTFEYLQNDTTFDGNQKIVIGPCVVNGPICQ